MAVNTGRTMAIRYTGKLDDGSVFDSNVDGEPLEFVVGGGQVIPGLDNAVTDLAVGDKVTILVAPEDAYGEHDAGEVQYVPVTMFGDGVVPQAGQMVAAQLEDGSVRYATALGASMRGVEVDFNHPLAGQPLTFEIEVVDVRDAPAAEDEDETTD